jgi:hypothetical protein
MGEGEGAEQRAPMGRAVIGGLITSTLLTLFVVPVVYTRWNDLGPAERSGGMAGCKSKRRGSKGVALLRRSRRASVRPLPP